MAVLGQVAGELHAQATRPPETKAPSGTTSPRRRQLRTRLPAPHVACARAGSSFVRVSVLHPPANRHARAWALALTSRGHTVTSVVAPVLPDLLRRPLPDLVISHVFVRDVLHPESGRYVATRLYEQAGVPVLNSSASIAISSDKAATSAAFLHAGLSHPRAWPLEHIDAWPGDGDPLIVKPAFAAGGRDVHLVDDLDAARHLARDFDGPAILQEYVREAVCVRVIATQSRVLSAVEKRVPAGTVVAAIGQGAKPVYIDADREMSALATGMVRATGGTLMGVDVLRSPRGLHALEVNVPFAFNLERPTLMAAMTDVAERVARGQEA